MNPRGSCTLRNIPIIILYVSILLQVFVSGAFPLQHTKCSPNLTEFKCAGKDQKTIRESCASQPLHHLVCTVEIARSGTSWMARPIESVALPSTPLCNTNNVAGGAIVAHCGWSGCDEGPANIAKILRRCLPLTKDDSKIGICGGKVHTLKGCGEHLLCPVAFKRVNKTWIIDRKASLTRKPKLFTKKSTCVNKTKTATSISGYCTGDNCDAEKNQNATSRILAKACGWKEKHYKMAKPVAQGFLGLSKTLILVIAFAVGCIVFVVIAIIVIVWYKRGNKKDKVEPAAMGKKPKWRKARKGNAFTTVPDCPDNQAASYQPESTCVPNSTNTAEAVRDYPDFPVPPGSEPWKLFAKDDGLPLNVPIGKDSVRWKTEDDRTPPKERTRTVEDKRAARR